MQPTERPPREGTSNHGAKDPVSQVASPQPVPVREKSAEALKIRKDRILQESDTDLVGQKGAAPPIMIPAHDRDGEASVYEAGEGAEHARVSPGDYGRVFEPKIEQVPVEDQRRSVFCRVGEPAQERLFRLGWHDPEVDVAGDMEGLLRHGDHKVNWVYYPGKYGGARSESTRHSPG